MRLRPQGGSANSSCMVCNIAAKGLLFTVTSMLKPITVPELPIAACFSCVFCSPETVHCAGLAHGHRSRCAKDRRGLHQYTLYKAWTQCEFYINQLTTEQSFKSEVH